MHSNDLQTQSQAKAAPVTVASATSVEGIKQPAEVVSFNSRSAVRYRQQRVALLACHCDRNPSLFWSKFYGVVQKIERHSAQVVSVSLDDEWSISIHRESLMLGFCQHPGGIS